MPRRSTTSDAARGPDGSGDRVPFWRPASIVVLGALAYANSFSLPLLFDDRVTLLENPQLRPWWNPAVVLFPARELPVAGRPLVNLSFAVNAALGGGAVAAYHLVNLLVHLACGLLLFALVRHTVRLPMFAGWRAWSADAALVIALVWTAHPVNSEVVDYLTQRTESMMAFALLATVYAAARAAAPRASRRWTIAAVAASLAGMACKETMVVAPILALLYDATFVAASLGAAIRARWRLHAAVAGTWVLLALLLAGHPRSGSAGFSAGVGVWTYLLNQAPVIVHYIRLIVWPVALVANYGTPGAVSLADVAPQAAAVIALAALTGIALVRWRGAGFLGAWFFLTLAPTSSVVPIATEVAAERRLYVPSMAAVALVVLVVAAAVHRGRARGASAGPRPDAARRLPLPAGARWALLAGVIALLAALGAATRARNAEYASGLRLAETTAERWPSPVASLMLGTELAAAGRPGEALPHLRQAAAHLPRAEYHLGVALFNAGDLDGARQALARFLAQEAGLLEAIPARVLLGRIAVAQSRWTEAVAQLEEAARMAPASVDTKRLLAAAYAGQGAFDKAVPLYQAYVDARPDEAAALADLGGALAATGRLDEAIAIFRRAVTAAPFDASAQRNLATALYDRRDAAGAKPAAERAVQLAPDDAAAHDLLGRILAVTGDVPGALVHFERALQLKPDDAQARDDLEALRTAIAGRGSGPARTGR